MRLASHSLILGGLFLVATVLFPPKAYAYVDPGTGSYILQVVIAGIAAGSFALKLFWGRIRTFFSRFREEPGQEPNA
jgi:hypothetical protein